MLHTPNIAAYLKIFADGKVKEFVLINFGEFFKSTRAKLYSKLSEEKNLRKVAELFYSFLITPDKIEKYVQLTEKMSEAKFVMQSSSSNDPISRVFPTGGG